MRLLTRRSAPDPPQRLGKQRATVPERVPARTELEPIVVTRVVEGVRHGLVGEGPVAKERRRIARAALEKDIREFGERSWFVKGG